jgi:2,3-bisphosphoglycerate-dependent phosphoglycerate mutase
MEPPALTRHRRPFLAPFWVMWLIFFLLIAAAFVAYRAATTTTVVLVRHAEKELVTIDDPPLSAAGERRAERLAQIFGDVRGPGRLDGIYVTPTRRSQQTAMPLAMRLGVKPTVLSGPTDADSVASHALSEHRGGRVLIVSHSNTLPALVQELSGQAVPEIREDEYDTIYVVTVPTFGKANVLRMKY